jgi:hypothetical protein
MKLEDVKLDEANRPSRLRGLACPPTLPRPPYVRPSRGRIITPMARPMRGRAIADPHRLAAINGAVATRGGRPIKKDGKLLRRCDCCDCAIDCAMPKYDPLTCGPCTPRMLTAGIGGVSPCPCTYMDDPVFHPAPGLWAKTSGVIDGVYCSTPEGAAGIFNAGPCIYYAAIPAFVEFWLDSMDCNRPADGSSFACFLHIFYEDIWMYAIIDTIASGSFGGAVLFWGRTLFLGWQATHVITNVLNGCGPWPVTDLSNPPFLTSGTWVMAKSGTIVVSPCCF